MNEFPNCFEIVWRTIRDKYFDPDFGGLDWKKVHDRYQPQIAAVESDKTFYELVNKMLFELNVSHLAVVPPDEKDQLASAKGAIMVDLRLLEEEAVITAVEPGRLASRLDCIPDLLFRK
jgi:carboxyl-terminal processing protease